MINRTFRMYVDHCCSSAFFVCLRWSRSSSTDTGGDSITFSDVNCGGNRVWTVEQSDFNAQYEILFSENGSFEPFTPEESDYSCVNAWYYDASANCSLRQTVEFLLNFDPLPNGLLLDRIQVASNGELVFIAEGDSDDASVDPSGISLQQISTIPDC